MYNILLVYIGGTVFSNLITDGECANEGLDTCNDGDIGRPSNHQIPGLCHTFNKDACLCELNGGCEYDVPSHTCKNTFDCSMNNHKPVVCNYRHCFFDCGTGTCSNTFGGSDFKCKTQDQCGMHCSNICACKSSGCQYTTTGKCRPPLEACPRSLLSNFICGRRDSFYVTKNGICKNTIDHGFCEVDSTIYGRNLGGMSFTDSRGISYNMTTSHNPFDKDEIALTFNVGNQINSLSEDDRVLYETVVYANRTKRKNNRCLIYSIPICADGTYELIIKTTELFNVEPGEKSFNIRLAGETVVSEVDIIILAHEILTPVELIIIFRLQSNILTVEGYKPILVKNKTIDLEFCYGECIFLEGHFTVAAFAVNKLKEIDSPGTTLPCNVFDQSPWDCISYGCTYNRTTDLCSTPVQEGCQTNDTCQQADKCLELLFILDSSTTNRPPASLVFDRFQEIVNVVDVLKTVYPCSKYGVSLYSEFSCVDFLPFYPNACTDDYGGGLLHHSDPEGCYRRHQVLTADTKLLKQNSERSKLSFRFSDGQDAGKFALFLAAQDKLIGWTTGTLKVIVLIADEDTHNLPFEFKQDPKFDGSDSCTKTRQPTSKEMEFLFKREQIAILMIGVPGYTKNFNMHLSNLPVPHRITDINKTPLEFAKDIIDLAKML